ncbi:FGGY-family carbohydrate kinase [Synechococcus sp. CBW1004]|uniref:FGGY-family carbohydrate kinase n=1 Tax=Synechococcus sp. CBW1004 TaxID=1353136 RepID=UPI0018CD77A2|nr:FGGY-family carbohydrate kinase [Synechococcus sp. CBW1004]QPN63035.1 sugar kinase [Synechococcus sp. CBW1004]
MSPLALGLDLGSSGLRLALAETTPAGELRLLSEESAPYPRPFADPHGWREGLTLLVARLDPALRARVGSIAIAGTSGTLLGCRPDGTVLPGEPGLALPYHLSCPEQAEEALRICGDPGSPAASASGSLARALRLIAAAEPPFLLRHQADWLMGWLLGDMRWGEEGNNLRLGWDLQRQTWGGTIAQQPWAAALPEIRPSGAVVGRLHPEVAASLALPAGCRVVAGSTDANAGVLATGAREGDGITVLGTTLVLKQFVDKPIQAPGVSCHRVDGRWLLGGASNAGAGILRRFFDDAQIAELSRQIDPRRPSGLDLLPLPARGERFPVDDPLLEPRLEPRPVSDALYLQALLEGLTELERQGWQRLRGLGAPPLQRVLTLGGGARNPQWRLLRQRALGVPVLQRPGLSAALGMARLALRSAGRMEAPAPADA